MIKRILISTFLATNLILISSSIALAHVVVSPSQVGVGSIQTFTVGVPNEKNIPVTGVRLLIPNGLKDISPNVKSGWEIDIKKTGEGGNASITEIDWNYGSIPPGQRDDFVFSAKVPAKETLLNWKAYQTYEDGIIVSWDQDLKSEEKDNSGPYSQTKIVNDLNKKSTNVNLIQSNDNWAITISIAALLISIGAILLKQKK